MPSVWLIVATVLGGTFAAGGANAINMYVDRDIDAVDAAHPQPAARHRPHRSPRTALVFAVGLEVVAFAWLWGFVNLLSAVLAVAACLFYVFVYTLWLKRTSKRNIVIGGAAGRRPGADRLVGGHQLPGLGAVLLFAVIFFWTPPHFWALAIRYKDDYAAADVPMLPVGGLAAVHRRAHPRLHGLRLGPHPGVRLGRRHGRIYGSSAVVLGAVFTGFAVRLYQDLDPVQRAMRLFTWSITYVTLLFGAMALDVLVRSGL